MRKQILLILAILVGTLAAPLSATASAATTQCGDTVVCTTSPATATTSTLKKGSSTSTTTTTTTSLSRKKTKIYESTRRVIVAINIRESGVRSLRGCVDPIRKGWIKAGRSFVNERLNGGKFTDRWKAGRKICNPKRVKFRGMTGYAGYKDNCDNWVFIRVRGKRLKSQTKRVEEYRSYKEFEEKTNSSSTSTTPGNTVTTTCSDGYTDQVTTCVKVTYSCPPGATMVLENGKYVCKVCKTETTACPPPPPPPPCPYGSVYSPSLGYCVKDGGTTPPPPGPGSPNPAPGPNPTNPGPGQPGYVPPSQCFDAAGRPVPVGTPGAICG